MGYKQNQTGRPITIKNVTTTSISANADGPRDAASRKIDHNALPAEYNYQQRASVDSKLLKDREMSVTSTIFETIMLKFHFVDLLYSLYVIQASLQQTQ